MSAVALPVLTPKEYLAFEERSEFRHEYLDGVMYAMAGGTPAHSILGVAICSELRTELRGRKCKVYNGKLQMEISDRGPFFYPDASVACGHDSSRVLIVEVLSKSTEKFDRGVKFHEYKTLASLQEYVLIAQNEPRIEIMRRNTEVAWIPEVFSGLDATARFESIGCSIALANIYEGVPAE